MNVETGVTHLSDYGFGPEVQLMVVLGHPQFGETQAEHIRRLLDLNIDWDKFLALVRIHGLVPQGHLQLSTGAVPIPMTVRTTLAGMFSEVVRRNLWSAAELVRIAARFDEAGICVVNFKGPTLAQEVYGGLERREYVDLDLLIQPADLRHACRVLTGLGYEGQGTHVPNMPSKQLNRLVRSCTDVPFCRADRGPPLAVELHWRLAAAHLRTMPEDEFVKRTSTVRIAGHLVNTIPRKELLMYLAYHGGKHRWTRLCLLRDFVHLFHSFSRDEWNDLKNFAACFGAERYFMLGLVLAEQLGLVEDLSNSVKGVRCWRDKLKRAAQQVFRQLKADPFTPSRLYTVVWYYRWTGRVLPGAMFLAQVASPNRDDWFESSLASAYSSRLRHVVGRCFDQVNALRPGETHPTAVK